MTRTGDLDGGTVDDTLTFDLRLKGFTGSSYTSPDVTLGTAYDLSADWDSVYDATTNPVPTPLQHFGPGGDIDNNQSFQLSIENIFFDQGEGDGWAATFDGFSAISKYGTDNTTYYFGTTAAESIFMTGDGDAGFSGPVDVLTVTATANGNRFRDLDFAFTTAIPEPGTYALLPGLTGLAFVMARRGRS
ncbi:MULTISPECIES: PEP-CTERM sorting domain-containing protein [unclassified Lentimonas]|uniref:PEP-CTERM sorting domain-containing protein n=1 Tax=unclassified Lentimonas TaxID=2630993 RepID=UPI001389A437|nr:MULTISPECIES: PEP-CTERM sorting domain-containing protein [unclassified Lentimonas]